MSAARLPQFEASSADATASGAALCMRAQSPHGPVWLLLEGSVHSAPQAAIALHQSAAWLDALEDWLAPAGPLRWAPAELPGERLPAMAAVSEQSDGDGGAPHRVGLPWSMLAELPPPPAALGLCWPAQPAELLLGWQGLPPEDIGQLAEGSALLLEASFATPWLAALRRVGAPAGRALRHEGGQVWADGGHALSHAAPGMGLEIHQRLVGELPTECLAGWRALPQPLPLQPRASLWWVGDGAGPELLAQGRLLPWGRGQALRIEQVVDQPLLQRLQQGRSPAERAWT